MEIDSGNVTDVNVPWYRASKESKPFALSKVLSPSDPDTAPFHCTASFPWSPESIGTLWDGAVTDDKLLLDWKATVNEWKGTIVAGSTGRLYLFPKLATVRPYCFRLHDASWEIRCAAWALSTNAPVDPLIVFTASSAIFILDVKTQKIIGKLRGHGGPITSLAVHPLHPYLFCTTSRDFTIRVYDLTLPPLQKPNNPHWPPGKHPSLAGPAHGLQMSESEGEGIGRCVAVLVGGRSGGHRGAVFAAAFHRSAPLIATCGMDRAVKIWRIPPLKHETLAREDKPLFSTDFIHKARVLSISWLSHDILISHSAPALMRGNDMEDLYDENGTVVIWRWLAFDRFFPPGKPIQKVMRGCASDYRGSESFKIISAYHLPMSTLVLTVYADPTHDPLILIPIGRIIRVMNITHFLPRDPPPFPLDEEVVTLTKRMRLDDEDDDENVHADAIGEQDGGAEEVKQAAQPSRLAELFEKVKGWDVSTAALGLAHRDLLDIKACEMAFGGRAILGVGEKGTLFIWRLNLDGL